MALQVILFCNAPRYVRRLSAFKNNRWVWFFFLINNGNNRNSGSVILRVFRIKEPFILGIFLGENFQNQRNSSLLVLVLLGGDFSEAKNLWIQFFF